MKVVITSRCMLSWKSCAVVTCNQIKEKKKKPSTEIFRIHHFFFFFPQCYFPSTVVPWFTFKSWLHEELETKSEIGTNGHGAEAMLPLKVNLVSCNVTISSQTLPSHLYQYSTWCNCAKNQRNYLSLTQIKPTIYTHTYTLYTHSWLNYAWFFLQYKCLWENSMENDKNRTVSTTTVARNSFIK